MLSTFIFKEHGLFQAVAEGFSLPNCQFGKTTKITTAITVANRARSSMVVNANQKNAEKVFYLIQFFFVLVD